MPSDLASIAAKGKAEAAAHEQRMASDPEYRAKHEKREAELQASWDAGQRRELERARRVRRDAAQIPDRVRPMLDAPDRTEALAAVERFMAGDRTFLVLAGGVGCGKTVAACAALDLRGGLFIKAAGVTRARFDDTLWTGVLRASVLVVDDLGTESLDAKGWAAGALAELFDHRYDWLAKTILTTNLDPEAFKARYCEQDGGRFLSRLREAGVFEAIAQESLRVVR